MPIDYEKEYDSRARVPEHPEIFARRDREAEAYRKATPGAALGLAYGPTPRQTIDLFPVKDGPLALFIHGGWWRSLGPESFSHMAKGPNAHGVGVGVVGYDLCPQVSVAAIIEEMRAACLFLWRRYGQRITAYGSSAGGHLVACLVATDFSKLDADAPADLVPAGYGISGVYDAAPAVQISVNQDLHLTADEARRISPVHWRVPPGRTFDAVVGGLEFERVLPPGQGHCRGLGRAGRGDALRRNRRHQSFHHHRPACRSRQRHDRARGGNGARRRRAGALVVGFQHSHSFSAGSVANVRITRTTSKLLMLAELWI